MSFVDKDLLNPNCQVLLLHKIQGIVGVLWSALRRRQRVARILVDLRKEIKVLSVAQIYYSYDIHHCYRNLSTGLGEDVDLKGFRYAGVQAVCIEAGLSGLRGTDEGD